MMEELCTVLALGGGGVTKLVTTDGRIERIFNAKYPREYILMTEKMNEKTGRIKENAISL
jgi:oxygen-independent coproporphyrinogen-3 oxidase